MSTVRPHCTPRPDVTPKESRRPLHIRIGSYPSIIIVPYGLMMGIGFAAIVFVSLTFGAPTYDGLQKLSSALNLTLLTAVLFARLMSIAMEDGIALLLSQPIHTLLRPGFWLHGGIFGATAGAILAWKLDYVQSFSMFAGSLAMGLPLYETFSRIGCHTYGCCFGRVAKLSKDDGVLSPRPLPSQLLWRLLPFPAVRYSHPTHYAVTRLNPSLLNKPLVPIQLLSATLFLLLFLFISLPLGHMTTVELAGSTTLVCHAVVRLITETYRADYRGQENWWLSTTGKIALIQASAAGMWLFYSFPGAQQATSPHAGQQFMPAAAAALFNFREVQERVQKSLFAVVLGIVVYGVHIGEVGSWVTRKDKE